MSEERNFQEYIKEMRDDMYYMHHRVLPTGELRFNRFDKAAYLGLGEGSSIYDTSVVMGELTVGSHVWIGPYTLIEGIHGIVTIGDYVSINAGFMIFCHDSTKHYLSGGIDDFVKGDVTIGSHTVMGSQSTIMPGVVIGDHCVVGANSLVTRDVPPFSIASGTPAHVIGYVTLDSEGHVSFNYHADK